MGFQKKKGTGDGVVKSVFVAQLVLLCHVILIACLGCLVLFFRGVLTYMPWIFFGGSVLIGYSGYRFYQRMKKEEKSLRDMLQTPLLHGRSVEVSVLGGLASLRLGKPENVQEPITIEAHSQSPPKQLEDPETILIRELQNLAELYEKHLITEAEFASAKYRILKK